METRRLRYVRGIRGNFDPPSTAARVIEERWRSISRAGLPLVAAEAINRSIEGNGVVFTKRRRVHLCDIRKRFGR